MEGTGVGAADGVTVGALVGDAVSHRFRMQVRLMQSAASRHALA